MTRYRRRPRSMKRARVLRRPRRSNKNRSRVKKCIKSRRRQRGGMEHSQYISMFGQDKPGPSVLSQTYREKPPERPIYQKAASGLSNLACYGGDCVFKGLNYLIGDGKKTHEGDSGRPRYESFGDDSDEDDDDY